MRDLHTSTVSGAAAAERHRAQSTGDYVDPRDDMPTLAECNRDEAEAELYDFGGGLTDTFPWVDVVSDLSELYAGELIPDEHVPTLLQVGAALGGVVIAAAMLTCAVRRWLWSE